MSTTPPPGAPPPGTPGPGEPDLGAGLRPGYTAMGNFSMARMPTPGNAEFFFLVLALIVLAIVAWIFKAIDANDWMKYFLYVSIAYILSRGLAKASRVLEQ